MLWKGFLSFSSANNISFRIFIIQPSFLPYSYCSFETGEEVTAPPFLSFFFAAFTLERKYNILPLPLSGLRSAAKKNLRLLSYGEGNDRQEKLFQKLAPLH